MSTRFVAWAIVGLPVTTTAPELGKLTAGLEPPTRLIALLKVSARVPEGLAKMTSTAVMPTLPKKLSAVLALMVAAEPSVFSKLAPVRVILFSKLVACAVVIEPVTDRPPPNSLTALTKEFASVAVSVLLPVTLTLLRLSFPTRLSALLTLRVLSLTAVLRLKIELLEVSEISFSASAAVTLALLIFTPEPIKPASPFETSTLAFARLIVPSDKRALEEKATFENADRAWASANETLASVKVTALANDKPEPKSNLA